MLTRSRYPCRRYAALLALAPLVFQLTDAAAAEAPPDPFSGLQAMSAHDLSRYRGGFITIGGFEIAFSITIDIAIDESFRMSTRLNPLGNVNAGTGAGVAQPPAGGPSGSVSIESGDFPVRVSTGGGGIEQRVGTIDTTLVETIVNRDRVSQIVANTRNHAVISALTTVKLDLLNHSTLVGNGGLPNRGLRHLLGNLGRGLGVLRLSSP